MWVWPSSCNSRCVAALAVPASIAQLLQSSAQGVRSRHQADAEPRAQETAAGASPFPDLLAGLFAPAGPVADDVHATSSDGALRPTPDIAAGIEILLGGTPSALHEEATPSLVGMFQTVGKRSQAGQHVSGRASTRLPGAASKLSVAGANDNEPGTKPGPMVADQTTINLPAPTAPSIPLSSAAIPAGRLVAPEEAPLAELESGTGLPASSAAVTIPGPEERAAPVVGVPLHVSLAAMRNGEAPADLEESRQIVKTRLARNPAGIDAKPDAASTGGATADPANSRPGQGASDQPHPAPPAPPMAVNVAAPVENSTGVDLTESGWRRGAGKQASPPSSRKSSGSVVAQVLALGGQVPQTVDSVPPAKPAPQPVEPPASTPSPQQRATAHPDAPPKSAPQSPTGNLVPSRDTQVRVLDASTPDRDEVAFAVQMKAMPMPEDSVKRQAPATEGSRRAPIPISQVDAPAPDPEAVSQDRPSPEGQPDHAPARAERLRRTEAAPAEHNESLAGTPADKMFPHVAQDAHLKEQTAPERTDTTVVKPFRTQDAMEGETKPETAKTTSVRDVKLEVTGGERRVEVRLSERGGEVKMTVRTPDTSLASSLRENLPALSARLAESGFKTEAWHPAASSTNEWRHTAETSAGTASQDANQQSREQGREPQDDGGQQHPKRPHESTPQKEKGKDFAWLMSSLR
jgi:hypothetical protein